MSVGRHNTLSEEEEEEGLFKADAVNEEDPERDRGGPRARPRYPGVEDLFRRATFLRETHPYPSMRGGGSQVVRPFSGLA